MRFPSGGALASQDPGHAERSARARSAAPNLPGQPPPVRLRALPVAEALALLAGGGVPGAGLRWHEDYPMPETLDALAMLVDAHQAVGTMGADTPGWWLHQIVLVETVVGDVGFHGPPGPGAEVEIGYNVVAGLRGHGIASRACLLVVEQAWRAGAAVVRAETEQSNVASQRVLSRVGFHAEGSGRFVLARPEARS